MTDRLPVSGEPTGREFQRQQRPWCLPCRDLDGSQVWAMHLGVACDWHWSILSEDDQFALAEAVSRRHPRGGSIRTVIEQIWVIRVDLRQQRPPNTVEETWARDRIDFEEMEAANAALV
jgi:hypothetical protein